MPNKRNTEKPKNNFTSFLRQVFKYPDDGENTTGQKSLFPKKESLTEILGIKFFKRILGYLHDYRFQIILACLCSGIIAGGTGAFALILRPLLDGIFLEEDEIQLMLLPITFLLLILVKSLITLVQNYLMAHVSNWVVADIRHQLYLKLIRMPIKFHDENSTGRLLARVWNDVALMGSAVPHVIKNLIQQVLTCLVLTAVLMYQEWKLAVLLFVISPISFYIISQLGYGIRQLTTRSQELAEELTFHLQETFSGIRVLKAYTREDIDGERFLETNNSYARINIKASQWSALLGPSGELIGVVGIACIIMYGGYQVMNGELTPGAFFSFLVAMGLAYAPIRKIGSANKHIQSSIAAGQRVFALLDLENEEELDRSKKTLPPITHSLEFRNVTFHYEGRQKPALENINLRIPAGSVVALVGCTGSGKTTLANLILRFYDPTEGAIFIDGENIRDVTRLSLRRQIAMVAQDTILFDDTVKNNISLSPIDERFEDVVEAARSAHALEFIEKLPKGFETRVGEKGVRLSGGQRQRIAIARAILRNLPILILDEATSSLDSESERIVQMALANLMKNRTSLVIAHRLSTIQHADRIVVLSKGRIVGTGSHEKLFDTCLEYRRLYPARFKELGAQTLTL